MDETMTGFADLGLSPKILKALEKANERGAVTVGLTGRSGGKNRPRRLRNRPGLGATAGGPNLHDPDGLRSLYGIP